MKNYINIDGKKIPLSEETVNNFKKELGVNNEPTTYEELMKSVGKKIIYYSSTRGEIYTLSSEIITVGNEAFSEEQLESLFALNKLANVAYVLNDGWVPDWKYAHHVKYNIYISHKGTLSIHNWITTNIGGVFFKTRALAQKAIDILGEEEIRKALTLNYK